MFWTTSIFLKNLFFLSIILILNAVSATFGIFILLLAPALFIPILTSTVICEIILFLVVYEALTRGNTTVAQLLLITYSFLSGYVLAIPLNLALRNSGLGLGGLSMAVMSCVITFIAAHSISSIIIKSEKFNWRKAIQLLIINLVILAVVQVGFSFSTLYTPNWMDITISVISVFLCISSIVLSLRLVKIINH